MPRTLWSRWIKWLIVLALPIMLITVSLRLVTSHWFVRWEYTKAGFPPDPFGLSTEERIDLANVCVDYLATNADISLLSELELPNGDPAFNQRELRHMADVQFVYRRLMIAGAIAALISLGGLGVLRITGHAQEHAPTALFNGSLLTLGLLLAVGAFMALSWGNFFTGFHRLFFEGDTWLFPISDTLIRLFPMRFWIDVAITIVVLLVMESVALGAIGWQLRRKAERRRERPRTTA